MGQSGGEHACLFVCGLCVCTLQQQPIPDSLISLPPESARADGLFAVHVFCCSARCVLCLAVLKLVLLLVP